MMMMMMMMMMIYDDDGDDDDDDDALPVVVAVPGKAQAFAVYVYIYIYLFIYLYPGAWHVMILLFSNLVPNDMPSPIKVYYLVFDAIWMMNGMVYWVYHITYCNLFIVVYIETYYTTTNKYVTYIVYNKFRNILKYNLENKISKILLFQVFLW